MIEKLTVSIAEAVEMSGVGKETIREWLATGLPHFRSVKGGKIYIPVQALRERVIAEAEAVAEPVPDRCHDALAELVAAISDDLDVSAAIFDLICTPKQTRIRQAIYNAEFALGY